MRRYPGTAYRGGQRRGPNKAAAAFAAATAAGGLSLPGPVPRPSPGVSPGSFNNFGFVPRAAANDLLPWAGRAARVAGLGARLLPWVGWAFVAWELYNLYQQTLGGKWGMRQIGYTETLHCREPTTGYRNGTFAGCAGIIAMGSPTSPLFPPYPVFLHKFEQVTPTTGRPAIRWDQTLSRKSWWVPNPWSRPYEMPAPGRAPDLPPNPAIDPGVSPIGVPMPIPAPVPWPAIPDLRPNPNISPDAQPQRGPNPNVDPSENPQRPDPVPVPWPLPVPPGAVPAPVPPPVIIEPGPAPSSPPVIRPGARPGARQNPRPPGKGERERKVRTGQAVGARIMWVAVNAATEGYDLLKAIWMALPAKFRTGPRQLPNGAWVGARPDMMLMDLWEHYQEIDVNKMAQNILMEELGDRVAGGLGQGIGRGNKALWESGLSIDGWTSARGPAL